MNTISAGTISAGALARDLNTSRPRVARAIKRLGIDARTAAGRLALTPAQVRRVRQELGTVPAVDGLTRTEILVLAALRSAPLGLASRRAVARRARISPAAASRALDRLARRGLVGVQSRMIAAGRAQEAAIWQAELADPTWSELDPILDRVEISAQPDPDPGRVPRRLRHLFWNTAAAQLEVAAAGAYIARRLLQTMDLQGLAWGVDALTAEDWREGARARSLDRATRALAENLAQGAAR